MNIVILIRNTKLLKQNKAYLFIVLIAIGNFLQLIMHFLSGFMILFQFTPPYFLHIVFGAILNFGFDSTCILNFMLSMNRLFLFFHFKGAIKDVFLRIAFIICFMLSIFGLFYLVISFFPFFSITFDINVAVWDYKTDAENYFRFNGLESKVLAGVNYCSVFVLFIIFFKIIVEKICLKHKDFKKYEIFLFLQAVFNFLCIFAVQILWQKGGIWFPNSIYLYTYLNFLWLNVAGRDSVINVLLVREIRDPVVKLILCKRDNCKVLPVTYATKTGRAVLVTGRSACTKVV